MKNIIKGEVKSKSSQNCVEETKNLEMDKVSKKSVDQGDQLLDEKSNQIGMKTVQVGPDGGWGWVCTICAFFLLFINGGIFARSFGIIYLGIGRTFPDSHDSLKAWIPGLRSSLAMVLSPFVSAIALKTSPRKVICAGGLLMASSLIVSSFVRNAEQLIFTLGISCGIGSSMLVTLLPVIIGRYFQKKRAFANGIYLLGSSTGGLIVPYILNFLIETFGLRGSFLILAGITLNAIPLALLIRPVKWYMKTEKVTRQEKDKREFTSLQDIEQKIDEVLNTEKIEGKSRINCTSKFSINNYIKLNLLKDLRFTTVMLGNCLGQSSNIFVTQFLPSLVESRGVNNTETSMLLSAAAVSDFIGRLAVGYLIYKYSIKPWLVSAFGMLIASISIMILALVPIYEVTMVSIVLKSFFFGSHISVLSSIYADDYGAEHLIYTIGLNRAFVGSAILLLSPILGLIKDKTGSFKLSFMVMSIMVFISFVLYAVHQLAQKYDMGRERAKFMAKN